MLSDVKIILTETDVCKIEINKEMMEEVLEMVLKNHPEFIEVNFKGNEEAKEIMKKYMPDKQFEGNAVYIVQKNNTEGE